MRRSWHHFEKWECLAMYETLPPIGYSADTAVEAYTDFLANLERFKAGMRKVMREWHISCEQFLSNVYINRVAWLGQSAMCIDTGIPCKFRAGFARLKPHEQEGANRLAARYLAEWEAEFDGTQFSSEPDTEAPTGLRPRISHYLDTWGRRGYSGGIPDEVPSELMRLNFAPSHKAVAWAIISNDFSLSSLGYSRPISPWYGVIKRVELENRKLTLI